MYVTSIEMRCCKYVANFHTSQSAEEFVDWLFENKYDKDERYINVKQRRRNSVVFLCHDRQSGYEIANEFEAFKIAMLEQQKKDEEIAHQEKQEITPIVLNDVELPNLALETNVNLNEIEEQLESDSLTESDEQTELIVEEQSLNKDNVLNKIFSIRK